MKTKLITLILLFNFSLTYAQTWNTVGGGVDTGLYHMLWALDSMNGKLYAGGYFTKAGGMNANCIASWDGTSWDSLGGGISWADGYVLALGNYSGKLIVGGYFNSIGGKPISHNIASWNGTKWDSLGKGVSVNGEVSAMTVFNGNLIVAGAFDSAGGHPAKNIAMWNGATWSPLGNGLSLGYYNGITALAVYNGELYATSQKIKNPQGSDTVFIVKWNGITWDSIHAVTVSDNFIAASTMAVYGGQLCIGGLLYGAIGSNLYAAGVIVWNGSTLRPLMEPDNTVFSLCSFDGLLYLGGAFNDIAQYTDSTNMIASTNGINIDTVGHGLPGNPLQHLFTGVYCMASYNGNLYAGGGFGASYNNIAEWQLNATGINNISSFDADILVYPNPSNGIFQIKSEGLKDKSFIEVYNMLGAKVYSNYINQTAPEIDLSNSPAGIYLYRVTSLEGRQIAVGKLVIER
jgi:hypothetical protein